MNRIFFLDRDGVINAEVDYLHEPDKMQLLPGVPEAVREIHRAGFLAVVVSNQSGIARKMFGADDVFAVHARIQRELLQYGGECVLDGFYFCPHHKDITGECICRKPHPGMLLAGCRDFQGDAAESFMVGDRMSDLNAGRNAGCKASVLVLTGYGKNEVGKAEAAGFPVAQGLLEAVHLMLGRKN